METYFCKNQVPEVELVILSLSELDFSVSVNLREEELSSWLSLTLRDNSCSRFGVKQIGKSLILDNSEGSFSLWENLQTILLDVYLIK